MEKKPRKSRAKPGAKRGGSKPRGPEPLTEQVGIKLSAAQHARVVELATAARVTPAEWARARVEEAITRAAVARSVDAAIEAAAEMRRELGREHARQIAAHPDAVGGMPSATE